MRKVFWVSLFMVVFILTGCSKNQEEPPITETSTSESRVETNDSQMSSTIETTSETSSSESSSESTTDSEIAESSSQYPEEVNAFNQLKEHYSTVALPTEIPHTEGNVLNIASDGTEDSLSVLYFDMETPLILNKKELNNETPIAHFQKETYPTKQEAEEAVSLRVDTQGQKVDLGYGITGFQQGAAGSSYLAWQEGNWHLVVRASNIEQQDPVAMAKEIVEYLEKEMLPAPEEVGQITVDMNDSSYRSNEVSWQVGKVAYTIRHQDPIAALTMAVSMEK